MEKKDEIRVLVVEPMKEPYEKIIPNTLEAKQKEVDGYIEVIYPFADEVGLICNEEGKFNGLELNRAIYNDDGVMVDIIAGKFLLVGLGEEDFTSLTQRQADKYKNIFKTPEGFVRSARQILVVPMQREPVKLNKKGKSR